MPGLFEAIVLRERETISGEQSPPPHPPGAATSEPTLPLHRESEQFCSFSTFRRSGYLKCQDIYSAYVW